jgi:hypothetical protein
MSYKILKQTDKAFQIKHPDGSTFTVPKKGLSKSMMDKIAKIPGFAEGGPISVSDPMTQQDREVGQRLRENELEYQKRLVRPSESAISPGYLPEAPVTESEISPIDFITPGMVAAPVKAAAKGAGMLGRGAMAVGREAVEAAPRILGNEIGAVGRDVKAAAGPRMVMPGMYSKAEQSIAEKMGGSASPQQIMGILKEAKPEEIEFLGIPKFLEGKTKVTKDEMLGHIRENLPKIQQTVLGGAEYERLGAFKKTLASLDDSARASAADAFSLRKSIYEELGGLNSEDRGALEYYSQVQGPGWQEIKQRILGGVSNPARRAGIEEKLGMLEAAEKDVVRFRTQKQKMFEENPDFIEQSVAQYKLKPKFEGYTTPGGQAYQENLYTLPKKPMTFEEYSTQYKRDVPGIDDATILERYPDYVKDPGNDLSKDTFKSPHFQEPNILAHSRTNMRTGPSGEKHLFAEEIQSDWHQAGRSKGYLDQNAIKSLEQEKQNLTQQIIDLKTSAHGATEEQFEAKAKELAYQKDIPLFAARAQVRDLLYAATPREKVLGYREQAKPLYERITQIDSDLRKLKSAVPDAPMKKTWHEFVSKRLLHDAAESGADNVSWTTGAQQAARYDLAKSIDTIHANDIGQGIKTIEILPRSGQTIYLEAENGKIITGRPEYLNKSLSDVLGKEMTEKIQNIQTGKNQTFSGDDLKIGGEGMKGFYDKIIPDYMNKLGKKYGVKVETATLPEAGQVHTMKLTPEMKQDILKKGFPLFTGVAAIGAQKSEAKEPKGLYNGGKVESKMGYRIIKDAEDHYQVMHPDGSKFTVPKKGISKQMHEKISGMPKLYNGGLMSDAAMEEAAMLPAPTFTTPLDAEIDSIQNQLGSGGTLSSDVAVPLANRLAQLKTVQGSIIDAKRNPVSGGLPEHYRFDKSAANMPSQEMQPSRAPAVEVDESMMMEEPPIAPQVAQPVAQFAPQNQYDAMFQTMGGRLAAPAKALATAENDYRMRTLLAQNEAEVRQQEMNDYVSQADKEAADFAEANRVDPNRYWASMNTGNKIQAALAIALGGIGAGLAGGENQALKIINKAIDADIDAQKENRNSLYSVMLAKHKRHETALSVAKADALQKVQNALNTFTVQAKTAEAQQGAAKLANDLDLQKMAYTDYYRKKNASDYLEAQAVRGANLRPEEINLLPKDTQERFINGVGKASNPQTAIKIRETKANADDINDMLDKLEIIRSQSGRELAPSVAAERADTLAKVLIGKLREPVLGPGTMNPEEYKRLQVMIPVVTDIVTLDDNVFARLGIVRDIVNTNLDNKIRAEGIVAKPRPKKMENAPGMQQGLMLNK